MPDSQHGSYQTPSSRPPEPPYRTASSTQARHELKGQSSNADLSGIDAKGDLPLTGTYAPIGSSDATESFHAARSGDTATMPAAGAAGAPRTYQVPPQSTPQAKKARTGSGAGKTFLFGFLGALLACGLCLGGFALANGFTAGSPSPSSTLGNTSSSTIDAANENQTLAEAVAAKALPSVCAVYNYQQQSSFGYGYGYGTGTDTTGDLVANGMGSAVIISDDGYILTNYHVVENAAKLTISVDGKERDATYVGGDSSSDIAVLKVDDTEGLVAADIGDSDGLRIGEWVMTIGAPLGLEQSVATGVVSATNRSTVMDSSAQGEGYGYLFSNTQPTYTYYPNMIQTDAVINPGNSGGALVDADGKLIGINSMLSSYSGSYAGVGFAIPVNYAISIANDIIAGKEPSHAALGVSISQVNAQTAQRYNLSATSGAYIARIYDGTGAADSDLAVGDIITAIDGKAISSTSDVTLDVREHAIGDTVTVTVNRNGETIDIPVVLTSDDSIATTESENTQNQNPLGNGGGMGEGNGSGNGNSERFNMEDLEDFLRYMGF